ncbi:MAG: F0F1 ATP synthase subunit epsilon [Gloeomargaritaceae cyanobacterium C42_A2020_066]|nr:F0F1 ATP synthase subunit epsilon [Gloeomargaritaceae cyanobacterium C42_A2020_066]
MTLTIRVITPDKTVWDGPGQEVILPSTTGQLGILTGHAPLLTALDAGVMRVRTEGQWVPIALLGGFAEVENNEVTVLVNGAQRGDQIDPQVAQRELEVADAAMAKAETRKAKLEATQALKRARARYQASQSRT